jgi:hypothetical protein
MAFRVPGQGGDAVTQLDALTIQGLCHTQRAAAEIGQGTAPNRALDAARDHLALPVVQRAVVQDGVGQQRVVLHQA